MTQDVQLREAPAGEEAGAGIRWRTSSRGNSRTARSVRFDIVGLSVAWVVLATCLQLVRGPGHQAPTVIWAEDGAVFLNQAMRHPIWHNLITPHAGYLQVVARLVAQPAGHLPLSWAAAWLATASAAIVALLSLVVWFASGRVLRHLWARLLVTALLPLLPQAGFEVNAAANDLHWYLAYAAFWVLLAAPRSPRGQLVAALVVALAALSDPLTILVLPAALLGLLRGPRTRLQLLAPAVMVVALAMQGWVHLTGAGGYRVSPTVAGDLPRIYALRVVTSAATGDRLLVPLYQRFGLPAIALIAGLIAVGIVLLAVFAGRIALLVAAVTLIVSIAYLVGPLAMRGTGGFLDRDEFSLGGSRYTIVPILLLWTAVILLLDRYGVRLDERGRAIVALPAASVVGILLAGFLAAQLLSDWGMATVRSPAPTWADSLRQAAAVCRLPRNLRPPQPTPRVGEQHGRVVVPIRPGPDDVTIPVPPFSAPGTPPLFAVVAPCSAVPRS